MKNAKQTTMKALVKAKPGIGLQMEQVPVPEYGANDVLVRIKKPQFVVLMFISGTGTSSFQNLFLYQWSSDTSSAEK